MENDLLKGSLAKALITFSVPLILSGLLQQLYSWADAFIVGNVEGESALAAIGATNVVTNLLIMAITGFTAGISILSARCFGSGDTVVQKTILSTFVVVLGGVFALLSLVGIGFADGMLHLLSTPAEIVDIATGYLQIVLIGIPFITVYNVYAAVLRGIGDSKAPFYSVLVSSITNVILDIFFVGVFGWGAQGAAAATVLSQVLMTAFLIWYALKRYDFLCFCVERAMWDGAVFKRGCFLSLPITVQSVVTAGGSLILQNFMNSFGTATVAAITTAYRIDSVILLPVINLGTGISTITSQSIGARQYQRAEKCLFVGLGVMTIVSVGLTAVALVIGGDLIALFGVTAEATQIGCAFFQSIAWFYIVFGSAMAIRGYIEGTGKVVFSGVCGILALAMRITLSYVMLPLFGQMVIAYAEAFSWCFQLLLYAVYLLLKERSLRLGRYS